MTENTVSAMVEADAPESVVGSLAEIFRLLGDPSRLRIVLACAKSPVSVGAIATRLGMSDSLVSHHLRLLRGARLVKSERSGKQVFYVVADHHVSELLSNMAEHVAEPREGDLT